jgi:hypothetical protein
LFATIPLGILHIHYKRVREERVVGGDQDPSALVSSLSGWHFICPKIRNFVSYAEKGGG